MELILSLFIVKVAYLFLLLQLFTTFMQDAHTILHFTHHHQTTASSFDIIPIWSYWLIWNLSFIRSSTGYFLTLCALCFHIDQMNPLNNLLDFTTHSCLYLQCLSYPLSYRLRSLVFHLREVWLMNEFSFRVNVFVYSLRHFHRFSLSHHSYSTHATVHIRHLLPQHLLPRHSLNPFHFKFIGYFLLIQHHNLLHKIPHLDFIHFLGYLHLLHPLLLHISLLHHHDFHKYVPSLFC